MPHSFRHLLIVSQTDADESNLYTWQRARCEMFYVFTRVTFYLFYVFLFLNVLITNFKIVNDNNDAFLSLSYI